MRRALIILIVSLLGEATCAQTIRDIDIKVLLQDDGSAKITEVWNVTVDSGTEWYLVADNLEDMVILDLSVSDESGLQYVNEGDWDVDRDISQKSGKCGLVTKSDGYEICWGVGSYGDHIFTVSYVLTNLVKSLNDYDAFNHQFIASGLSACPEHAKVTIERDGAVFDSTQIKIASFGYYGTIVFDDMGRIVAESDQSFDYNSSMIVLVRFEKGILHPVCVQERDYADMVEKALKGSDYEDTLYTCLGIALVVVMIFIPLIWLILPAVRRTKGDIRKGVFGCKPNKRNIAWCRDLPYGGNLYAANYTLQVAKMTGGSNAMVSALVLKMIMNGNIAFSENTAKQILISFVKEPEDDSIQKDLYNMILLASGDDHILQEKEFRLWAASHTDEILKWGQLANQEGINAHTSMLSVYTKRNAVFHRSSFNRHGQLLARQMLGFKEYLQDFTIINERKAVEVDLWREYLQYAALFGIARQVATDLKSVDSKVFSKVCLNNSAGSNYSITDIIDYSEEVSKIVVNYYYSSQYLSSDSSSSSYSYGGSGSSSYSGGGGHSGGGTGGGSR